MRACEMQYVRDGEIYCEGNNEPCDDGKPSEHDPHLLIGCGDCCEPVNGTKWHGAL